MRGKQARVKWEQTRAIRIRQFVVKNRLGSRSVAVDDGGQVRCGHGTGGGRGSWQAVKWGWRGEVEGRAEVGTRNTIRRVQEQGGVGHNGQ